MGNATNRQRYMAYLVYLKLPCFLRSIIFIIMIIPKLMEYEKFVTSIACLNSIDH